MRQSIFLDRDGVLNRAFVRNGLPYTPSSLDEVEIIPGVEEACGKLRANGYLLVVVTNQPDVARGLQSPNTVEKIHAFLRCRLPLDDIRVCYHDDVDSCDCRKPKPGMLLAAARDWGIDLGRSFMIGDRWRDIEAGQRAGCRTIFIKRGYAEPDPPHFDFEADSLDTAVTWLLSTDRRPQTYISSRP